MVKTNNKGIVCHKYSSKMPLIQNNVTYEDFLFCEKCKYTIELIEDD
ncbi:MAG: hypothetical protein NC222_06335 [Staphylococcus sp.]|nr:hypothetical protein [Staphylococcus sp.]